MKALDIIRKYIGKTKGMTEEGISATEKFQRVFFPVFENIRKTPHNIKEIFLSNVMYRTFSHTIHQTIDEKFSSFFEEKIETKQETHNVTNQYTWIALDPTLVKRSRKIGLVVTNTGHTESCEVHIRPTGTNAVVTKYDDLFYYVVSYRTESYFQFEYSFTTCLVGLKFQNAGEGEVIIKASYIPL